jgi:hypothetical protein
VEEGGSVMMEGPECYEELLYPGVLRKNWQMTECERIAFNWDFGPGFDRLQLSRLGSKAGAIVAFLAPDDEARLVMAPVKR